MPALQVATTPCLLGAVSPSPATSTFHTHYLLQVYADAAADQSFVFEILVSAACMPGPAPWCKDISPLYAMLQPMHRRLWMEKELIV